MIILSPNIPHHDVDKGVLYEGEEDKEGAGGHEHVDRLVRKHLNILILGFLKHYWEMEGRNSFSELGRSLVRLVSGGAGDF